MKKMLSNDEEFYVGYLPTAPAGMASFLRKFTIIVGALFLIAGVVVVLNQRDFSRSEFEYGEITLLSGIFMNSPVPRLRIIVGRDLNGKTKYQSVLLVGFGKHGADKVISQLKSNSSVTIKGYLIYYGGKALLQINDSSDVRTISEHGEDEETHGSDSQRVSAIGEIVDPKCYFGVMKPGEGKAHRSCAIRCIAGGMPPVLHQSNSEEYFLIVGQDNEPLNQKVLGVVGDRIELGGVVRQMDDWKVMSVNNESIAKMTAASYSQPLLALNDGITICSTH